MMTLNQQQTARALGAVRCLPVHWLEASPAFVTETFGALVMAGLALPAPALDDTFHRYEMDLAPLRSGSLDLAGVRRDRDGRVGG